MEWPHISSVLQGSLYALRGTNVTIFGRILLGNDIEIHAFGRQKVSNNMKKSCLKNKHAAQIVHCVAQSLRVFRQSRP